MKKIYCDICGNEIKRQGETWRYKLQSNEGNRRVSLNKNIKEICELCATVIDCCIVMRENGINPNWNK